MVVIQKKRYPDPRCIHKKFKKACITCSPMNFCIHGKNRFRCRDCGTGHCIHKKIRCIVCHPDKFCEHQKQTRLCPTCGHSHCEHGRLRAKCSLCCNPDIVCEHKRIRSGCRQCGNRQCIHGKMQGRCRVCSPEYYCPHNRWKYDCQECGGSKYCLHNKRKEVCREGCGGSSICQHNIVRATCRVCEGSRFCEHDKDRQGRKICKPDNFCEHSKRKGRCFDCGTEKCTCESCGLYVIRKLNQDGKRLCSFCNPHSTTRSLYDENRPEQKVNKYVATNFPLTYAIGTYPAFSACGDNNRPDTVVQIDSLMVIIETDERGHSGYAADCEWSKTLKHAQSALQTDGVANVLFIRFNPDTWMAAGIKKRVSLDERLDVLRETILDYADQDVKNPLQVMKLYYKSDTAEPVSVIDNDVVEDWLTKLVF